MVTKAIGFKEIDNCFKAVKRPFIWISIREPEENGFHIYDMSIPPNCISTLVLKFHDLISDDYSVEGIVEAENKLRNFIPFNLEMKRQVEDFILDNIYTELCIVNCYAGISRSSALAAYIEKLTGESAWYNKYYKTKGKSPTRYMCRILGLPISDLSMMFVI